MTAMTIRRAVNREKEKGKGSMGKLSISHSKKMEMPKRK